MTIKSAINTVFKQSSDKRIKLITSGKLKSTFLFMAIPGIITIIIQSTSPIIDGLLIFNFDGADSGAAVSYVSSLQNVVIIGVAGLASAGSAVIGKINGQGDFKKAKSVAAQLLAICFFVGIAVIPIMLITCRLVLSDNTSQELAYKILRYNTMVSFSLPFICIQSAYNCIKGVFGHPEKALIRILLFVPIKITLSVLFLAVLRMGIEGAALSNILSYLIISTFLFYDLFIKKSEEKFVSSDFKFFKQDVMAIYTKSWPAFIQNSTKAVSFFLIRVELNKYVTDDAAVNALSVNSIAGDINQVFMNLIACYDAAIIAFISVNIGAKNIRRAKEASYFPLKIGITVAIILTMLSFYITPFLVSLYTRDPVLEAASIRASRIYTISLISYAFMFIEMPAFTGLGLTKISLFIQFIRIWVVRLIVMYLLYWIFPQIGFYAVFWSLTCANLFGAAMSHFFFTKIRWASFAYR